jgi:peptidoglycan/LPS O-acetylase OafA/YrhL
VTRAVAIAVGLILITVAFVAATNVADTREGLIAEIVTLLAGLAGVGVLLFGLVPRRAPASQAASPRAAQPARATSPRTANDLLIGGSGLVVAVILIGGLLLSAGWQWALAGAVLLVPMIIGCAYLVVAFARARDRQWRIDLRRITSLR